MVDGADEEVEGIRVQEAVDPVARRGPDPVDLEAEQDRDVRGVFGAEAGGFGVVGGEEGCQLGGRDGACDLEVGPAVSVL